jgi:hypothetical protein
MHLLIIMLTTHLLLGEASTYPQKRRSSLETSPKAISFKKIKKNLIHFCITQREDIAWKFFGNKSSNQIGWPCKKIDGIWTTSVCYVKQFTDGGIIFPITIMWIVKRRCGFITLSYSNFSIPSTKCFGRSISSMITMPCLSITAPTASFRNMQTYSTIRLDFSMCGWVREFNQFKCSKITS